LNKDGEQDVDEDYVISPSANLRLIDNLFGIPDKIIIPERYIPDTVSTMSLRFNKIISFWWLKFFYKKAKRIRKYLQMPCSNFQDMDNQTPEERQVRLKKADSIRRMLADQGSPAANAMNSLGDSGSSMGDQSIMSAEVRQQMGEEKRQREHLLGLNQIIAQQVMEKSRMVAGRVM
jgi:hypothetical protein